MSSTKDLLAFVHVEKAAGTTFIHILRHNFFLRYLDVRPFSNHSAGVFSNEDLAIASRIVPGLLCISGHSVKPFSTLSQATVRLRMITMLREPLARYMSQYQYWIEQMGRNVEFEEFLEVDELKNFQTNKYSISGDLEEAKRALMEDFFLVGIVDEFDGFLLMLEKKLHPIRFDPRYEKKNMAKRKNATNPLKEKYYDKIVNNNEKDIELYQYARDVVYPKFIAEYGDDFSEDLQRFRENNVGFGESKIKRYVDYGIRKCYLEPISGLIRLTNGRPYKGSY
jgi:hypothetical protein